jgi:hypothetical protein
MAALIMVRAGVDWQSSGGLFDWTLEYLISRLSDRETAGWLQTVVDNNLASISLAEFPDATQQEISALLRNGLVATARRELPDGPAKASALARLQELVDAVGA